MPVDGSRTSTAGLREALRVADERSRVRVIHVLDETAQARAAEPIAVAASSKVFGALEKAGIDALGDAEALADEVREAGFEDVRTERETVTASFPSASEFARFMRAVAAPMNALLATHPPERRDDVWRAVADAAAEHEAGDGSVRLAGEVIYVVGRR